MLGASLLSALGLFAPPLAPLVWALDILLVVALLVDLARTPSPAALEVERVLPERVGLEREFERVVTILPGPAAGLTLELREEFPATVEVLAREGGTRELVAPRADDPTGGPDRVRLAAGTPTRVRRRYRANVRGPQTFGDLRLRLEGPLGLVQRQARLAGEQSLAVEPALAGLARTLKLAASERWRDLGVRRLRRRGGLTEFESLREYVVGDDPRLLDWKAFARHGRPYVREYQEERGQELILLVDTGRRMGATSAEGDERGWTKLDHALDAALQLAAVALAAGDRVGIATFDRRLARYVSPVRGRPHFARLREAVWSALPAPIEADLARALRELAVTHRRRAMVVILSDVADPYTLERQRRALRAGSRRHALVFAALDDPALRAAADGRLDASSAVRSQALLLEHERHQACAALAGSARVLDALPAEAAGPLLAAWLDARRSGALRG